MESQDLMELLLTRRTYRRFDQSRPVPEEVAADIQLLYLTLPFLLDR